MKTLTEFDSLKINQVIKRQTELAAESKTDEEQKVAIGEALKVEGEKLDRLLAAVDVAKKKPNFLKRVVVLQLAEGEKAPGQAVLVGELYYLCEYFPQPVSKQPAKRDFKGGPRGKGKGKGKGRGRRGDRRPQNSEGAEGRSASDRPSAERTEGGEAQKKRRRFRPRRPAGGGAGKPQSPVSAASTAAEATKASAAPASSNSTSGESTP